MDAGTSFSGYFIKQLKTERHAAEYSQLLEEVRTHCSRPTLSVGSNAISNGTTVIAIPFCALDGGRISRSTGTIFVVRPR